MAGNSAVLSDDTTLSRLDRGLARIEALLALVSGLAVFALMLLAVWSVGGRNFMGQPVRGYVDWIEQAMPLIAFMAISFTQRTGGHIRMDILVGMLRGRALWLAEFVTTLAILILMLFLLYGSWAHFDRSFDITKPLWSSDSTIDIGLPLWPAKLLAPVAFGVLCLRLVLQLWGYARAIATGTDRPVAVPLIESAAEIAAREAEAVSDGERA